MCISSRNTLGCHSTWVSPHSNAFSLHPISFLSHRVTFLSYFTSVSRSISLHHIQHFYHMFYSITFSLHPITVLSHMQHFCRLLYLVQPQFHNIWHDLIYQHYYHILYFFFISTFFWFFTCKPDIRNARYCVQIQCYLPSTKNLASGTSRLAKVLVIMSTSMFLCFVLFHRDMWRVLNIYIYIFSFDHGLCVDRSVYLFSKFTTISM